MSTKHLEPGEVLARIDGQASGDVADESHLADCESCRETADELRGASRTLSSALAVLDGPEPDVERALARVKAAAGGNAAAAGTPGRPVWTIPLARAAAVVLALGALASGLPGSPVRAWLDERFAPEETALPPAPAAERADPGVRLAPVAGRARISVAGLEDGAGVTVRLVEGSLVSVFADDGASFATDQGRVRVTDAGSHVVVEVPASVLDAAVEVDGRVVYRKVGDRIETPEGGTPTPDGSEVRIRP